MEMMVGMVADPMVVEVEAVEGIVVSVAVEEAMVVGEVMVVEEAMVVEEGMLVGMVMMEGMAMVVGMAMVGAMVMVVGICNKNLVATMTMVGVHHRPRVVVSSLFLALACSYHFPIV